MTGAVIPGAKWAVEVVREGDFPAEYYAIEALLIDKDRLRIKIAGGERATVELKRDGIKKILIMKTIEGKVVE